MRKETNGRIRFLYTLIQCTWGLPVTLIGLIFFLINCRHPHLKYRYAIDTQWNAKGGLSLGLFIFTPKDQQENAGLIRVHEYGHTIQTLLLGPLMIIPGIISMAWGDLPVFIRMRKEKGLPYSACFVEAWASRWGEKVTGEPAIWR